MSVCGTSTRDRPRSIVRSQSWTNARTGCRKHSNGTRPNASSGPPVRRGNRPNLTSGAVCSKRSRHNWQRSRKNSTNVLAASTTAIPNSMNILHASGSTSSVLQKHSSNWSSIVSTGKTSELHGSRNSSSRGAISKRSPPSSRLFSRNSTNRNALLTNGVRKRTPVQRSSIRISSV